MKKKTKSKPLILTRLIATEVGFYRGTTKMEIFLIDAIVFERDPTLERIHLCVTTGNRFVFQNG